MTTFSDIGSGTFNTQRDHWEKAFKAELKTEDLKGKTSKKNLDVQEWQTLALEANPIHIGNSSPWKKTAQTYLAYPGDLDQLLNEDLHQGVRSFFFSRKHLTAQNEKTISSVLGSFPQKEELEFHYLEDIICSREVMEGGGNVVQELGHTLTKFIDGGTGEIGVFLDSRFFSNIAKIRAMRLLLKRVQEETSDVRPVKILALNSYRDWTLYERYSNVLRNVSQVASALIAGADAVQSSGYQSVIEIEALAEGEHLDRSRRLARNTAHILSLESMLGTVEDAAYGSYHLESLTEKYAQEAWAFMQKCLSRSLHERETFLANEVKAVREARTTALRTRKTIMAGTNDYAHAGEHLNLDPNNTFFRTAFDFEQLRLKVEKLKEKPEVQIVLKGNYASLSARINFVKNYFELLGLTVHDPLKSVTPTKKSILVLCAADADYPELAEKHRATPTLAKFVAGKVEVQGYSSIYAGQNVYEVLKQLVEGWAK